MNEKIIKIIKIIYKIIRNIFISLFILFIISTVWIIIYFYITPTIKVENHEKEKTIELLQTYINISNVEINKVIFSQSMFYTFLWDGWYDIIIELTDEAKSRIITSKKTKLGELELTNIDNKMKCNFTDYNNKELEIVNPSIYNNSNFYYISEEYEYGWGVYLYISEQDNNLYYCNYRT